MAIATAALWKCTEWKRNQCIVLLITDSEKANKDSTKSHLVMQLIGQHCY